MEFLHQLLENAQFPVFTAFLLGIMTAISPCPMATNITAIGFVSKEIENQRKVFYSGLIYTLGRAISYTAIGLLFYFGAGQFQIEGFLQQWGEKIIGPILILIGLFMLGIIKLNIGGGSSLSEKMESRLTNNFWSVLLLGIVFALAFCPYSGVIYFGMLIPITITSVKGLYLPIVFAFATGLPVIIFAWLIAFSVGSVSKIYNSIKLVEKWFRRVVAVIFILAGIYYISFLFI